jgi:pre-mRNA-processing factor SLU7
MPSSSSLQPPPPVVTNTTTSTTTTTATAAATTTITSISESRTDRKQQREIQEARQAGTIAPATDVVTGQMINPHNPEFLTKRPWYLGSNNSNSNNNNQQYDALEAPSLQHQTDQRPDHEKQTLSLTQAEELLQRQRSQQWQQQKSARFVVGQWVEALKRNKAPYRICQILQVHGGTSSAASTSTKTQVVDVQYEDGTIETKIPVRKDAPNPRVRATATGKRCRLDPHPTTAHHNTETTTTTTGSGGYKESFVSKRDQYHGYDRDTHNSIVVRKFEQKVAIRRNVREQQQQAAVAVAAAAAQQKGATSHTATTTTAATNDIDHEERTDPAVSDADSDSDYNDSDVEGSDHDGNNHNNHKKRHHHNDSSDDEFVQRDEDDKVLTTRLARQGGVGGAQMKVTARNLRIREDRAKYLLNLDPNSAYYDPKSRSMRDDPHPNRIPGQETDYSGDNFIRISGDAVALAQQQLFAWDAARQVDEIGTAAVGGELLHPQANPSQVELLQKQFQGQANELQVQAKRAILNKYGGAEYLDGRDGLASAVVAAVDSKPGTNNHDTNTIHHNVVGIPVPAATNIDRQLRFGVSTKAEEYSRDGQILSAPLSNKKRKALESKYEENVYINGHTTVWGSYFHKGAFTWGYSDDHSLLKHSYCTGRNGRVANDEAHSLQYGTGLAGSAILAQVRQMLPPKNVVMTANTNNNSLHQGSRSKLYGEVDPSIRLDDGKVQEALLQLQRKAPPSRDNDDDEKDFREHRHATTTKRQKKYNSIHAEEEMTPEMMEAYRIHKMNRTDDPMAKISHPNELLERDYQ